MEEDAFKCFQELLTISIKREEMVIGDLHWIVILEVATYARSQEGGSGKKQENLVVICSRVFLV